MDPMMGIVGAIGIARWSWTLMRDTAAVLLDRTDPHVAAEIRDRVEGPGDARIADLHVWRVGPEAHAAIVSAVGAALTGETIRARLAPVPELPHLTLPCPRPAPPPPPHPPPPAPGNPFRARPPGRTRAREKR